MLSLFVRCEHSHQNPRVQNWNLEPSPIDPKTVNYVVVQLQAPTEEYNESICVSTAMGSIATISAATPAE